MADAITIPVVGTVDAGFLGELQQLYGRIAAVASGIAELSTEQTRLNATSARLGVSFDTASAAAGRYVDQIELQRAAEAAAQTGLRLTQTELDALARRAAQFSQATGVEMPQAIQQLTEAVVKGEAEGLNRFGGGLAEVGRQSGTAGERLRALVTDANATARATDDASTAAARLSGELRSVGRQASLAFTEQLTENVSQLSTDMGDAATRAEDLTEAVRGLGRFGADALTGIAALAGVVVGGIGTSVRALSHAFVELWTAQGRAMSRDFSGALASARAAFTATDELRDMADFTERSINAAARIGGRLFGDDGIGDVRGNGPPAARPGRSGVMEFSTGEIADAEARDRPTGSGPGGGRGASRGAAAAGQDALSSAADRLFSGVVSRVRGMVSGVQRTLADRSVDTTLDLRREGILRGADRGTMARMSGEKAEQTARDARDAEAAGLERLRDMRVTQDERDAAREERTLARGNRYRERTLDAQRSFADRMEDVFGRQASVAEVGAGLVVSAYDSIKSGAASAYSTLVKGGDDVGTKLRQILSDQLLALGQEAFVKALMETAEGIAALAGIYTAALAPGHFAAAAAYGTVAAAAGIGASLAAPGSASASSAANAGTSSRAASSAPDRSTREGGGTTININMSGLLAGSSQDAARQVVNLLRLGADQAGVQIPRRAVEAA